MATITIEQFLEGLRSLAHQPERWPDFLNACPASLSPNLEEVLESRYLWILEKEASADVKYEEDQLEYQSDLDAYQDELDAWLEPDDEEDEQGDSSDEPIEPEEPMREYVDPPTYVLAVTWPTGEHLQWEVHSTWEGALGGGIGLFPNTIDATDADPDVTFSVEDYRQWLSSCRQAEVNCPALASLFG